jgi:hypothetical protein
MNRLGEPVSETDRLTEWRALVGRAGQEGESGRRGSGHIGKMHAEHRLTNISSSLTVRRIRLNEAR